MYTSESLRDKYRNVINVSVLNSISANNRVDPSLSKQTRQQLVTNERKVQLRMLSNPDTGHVVAFGDTHHSIPRPQYSEPALGIKRDVRRKTGAKTSNKKYSPGEYLVYVLAIFLIENRNADLPSEGLETAKNIADRTLKAVVVSTLALISNYLAIVNTGKDDQIYITKGGNFCEPFAKAICSRFDINSHRSSVLLSAIYCDLVRHIDEFGCLAFPTHTLDIDRTRKDLFMLKDCSKMFRSAPSNENPVMLISL